MLKFLLSLEQSNIISYLLHHAYYTEEDEMPIREEFDDQGETKKIGAKKARKLEMKEEKRAQREVCVKSNLH